MLRQKRNSKNLYSSSVLFVIQMILVSLLTYTSFSNEVNTQLKPFCVLLCQAICSFLLHLSLYQKVQRTVEKHLFLQQNPGKFKPLLQPFMIAHMQGALQLITQLVAMFVMSK